VTSCDAIDGRFAELANRWRVEAAGRRSPIMGSVELTNSCNLSCRHCYIVDHCGCEDPRRELTLSRWERIFDQLSEAGCLWLGISGGEPLVHPEFSDIYRAARERGFLVTLLTNGTLITQRVATELGGLPPYAVEVTIYGASAETYERVTGHAWAYAACLAGVGRLLEQDIQVVLKSTLSRMNVEDLDQMRGIAERLGLPFRFDGLLNSRLDGSRLGQQIALEPSELVSLEFARDDVVEAWTVRAAQQRRAAASRTEVLDCGAAQNSFHIDWAGRLMPCVMLRVPAIDLQRTPFADGWHSALAEVAGESIARDAECLGCSLAPVCSHCAGFGAIEAGDPQASVDYLCRLAQERCERLEELQTCARSAT
jgi:radical SAM protein with 4Fe4S-binding SPASM domain